jgi:uncharacterized protein YjbI with pentapeptide repeats
MANVERLTPQLGIIRQGVDVWNQWREQFPDRLPDLSDADLKWEKLDGVNFSNTELGGAKLNGATLRRANLKNARLIGADLTGADLRNATLVEAWLIGAKLLRTDLGEADLRGAIFAETILSETDLTGTRGLDSSRHIGPSIIDHRTLLKSGRLPHEFLQGCGLPQELTEALPRLLADVKYYTCFISYGEPDKEFALRACLKTGHSSQAANHEVDHRGANHGLARLRQICISFGQAAVAAKPSKGPLDHPPFRPQEETRGPLGAFNHGEADVPPGAQPPQPGPKVSGRRLIGPK